VFEFQWERGLQSGVVMFAKKVNNGLACSVVCNTQLCDESFSRSMKQNACLSVEALEERVAVPGVDD
jgi:hypothetical protein